MMVMMMMCYMGSIKTNIVWFGYIEVISKYIHTDRLS